MKMVQRKVSNRLGVQANTLLLKTEKRQVNNKPSSLQIHDGKSKAPDLRIKKMKKSRPIKRAELEISLRLSPKTHQTPRHPGKPPPLAASPANIPSLKKASPSPCRSSSGSPNYMKSTSSSEAKKEQTKASVSNSLKLHRVVNGLNRESSLKKVRTLTKAPSFKHIRTGANKCSKVVLYENLNVQRNTCSSTLKGSKFPRYLKLNPGASEAEGTSAMKVCPYNYCSLNGHHHKPAPPLRRFLSSRRKLLKTQKVIKLQVVSPRKAKIPMTEVDQNEDFLIEIHAPEVAAAIEDSEQVSEILSAKACSESEDTVSSDVEFSPEEGPLTPAQDQASSEFSYDGTEEVDNSASVSLYEFFGEISEMEWEEGQINIPAENDDRCDQCKPGFKSDNDERSYFEDCVTHKLKSFFDEDILEYECFSDVDSVPDSESTKPGGVQMEESFNVGEAVTISSEHEDEIADEGTISKIPDFQSIERQDSVSFMCIEEIIEAGEDSSDVYQELATTQGHETAQDNYKGGDVEEGNNADAVMEEKIAADTVEDNLPKIDDLEGTEEETLMASNDSQVEVSQSEAKNDGFNDKKNENKANESMITATATSTEQNKDCVASLEEPEMQEINKTEEPETFTIIKDEPRPTRGRTFSHEGTDSSQELLDSCNKLKRSMRIKKENEDAEELRSFNPREPNFLPLEPDPEVEKVDLRHQEMELRRNAEEWMLDYALQKTVNQLAPARKRKVALLVEAFESVMPIPKCEPHLRRNSSGFAHARTIQACN